MNKRVIAIPVVLAVIFGYGYWVDRTRAERQSNLSGFFENQPTMAASRLGGRVTRILVREGDLVKKGQRLVELEDPSFEATTRASQHQAEQSRQAYLEAIKGPREEEIQQAQATLEEAQANLDRVLRGPRPEEIEAATHKVAASRMQLLKLQRGLRPEEIRSAEAAVEAARASLSLAEAGMTTEERNQLRARLSSAAANHELQQKELARVRKLVEEGALARARLDSAVTAERQAQAAEQDAQEALQRAEAGTRPEEIERLRAAYEQARAQLRLAQNGSRKEDIEIARQQLGADQANLELLRNGSRPEDIEAARSRVRQARAVLDELKRGTRPEDVRQAKAIADAATSVAKGNAKRLEERMVFAPFTGTVDRVLVADGDVLAAGAPVLRLSQADDIWLRVYIPERELSKVKIGDSSTLAIDGISEPVEATVISIASRGEFTPANLQAPEERGKQVFEVRIRLAKADLRVKAGMYATVKRVGQWP